MLYWFSRILSMTVSPSKERKGNIDIPTMLYDRTLLWFIVGLSGLGLVMVASSSTMAGQQLAKDPLFFAKRDVLYLFVSLLGSLITLRIPMFFWQRWSGMLVLFSIILLIIVLVVGRSVNGASRWISLGLLRIQPAEFAKLFLFCYLASYLVRKVEEVRNNLWGFCKPMGVMILFSVLLLAQPDMGTVIVLFVTTLGMLFISGAKLWQFFAIVGSGIFAAFLLIIAEPYRVKRVTSFWDPWSDPFGNGYQLTQSLVAFGRGNFFGQGLGNSIQKLAYLPEAHTDFIFSILGEELGYFGVISSLLMIFFIIFRAMFIGRRALEANQRFSGFLACSIGIWFSFQALVNVGGTVGMLPTKGLTLPFISYGGSSLFVVFLAVSILLRIDHEIRSKEVQAVARKIR